MQAACSCRSQYYRTSLCREQNGHFPPPLTPRQPGAIRRRVVDLSLPFSLYVVWGVFVIDWWVRAAAFAWRYHRRYLHSGVL